IDPFIRGLEALGYIDGKTVSLEYRDAAGDYARVAELADELVRLEPDVIFSFGGDLAPVIKKATASAKRPRLLDIPMVVVVSHDPVEAGLVASLGRPGATSPVLLTCTTCWPENRSSCSRTRCLPSPGSPFCGIRITPIPSFARRSAPHARWGYNCNRSRSASRVISRVHSKPQHGSGPRPSSSSARGSLRCSGGESGRSVRRMGSFSSACRAG